MTELMRTINSVNDVSSLQESVNTNTTNISTLQSYTVSKGTNFGVGPDALQVLTTGTQNTVLVCQAGRPQHSWLHSVL